MITTTPKAWEASKEVKAPRKVTSRQFSAGESATAPVARKLLENAKVSKSIPRQPRNAAGKGYQTLAASGIALNSKSEEKRLRIFRKKAPQSYLERLDRATSQRFVLYL